MLLGMIAPTSGAGLMLGKRIEDPGENREMRRDVAYVAEDKQTYAYMTVEQMIHFTRSFYADWQPEIEKRLLKQYQLPLRRKESVIEGHADKTFSIVGAGAPSGPADSRRTDRGAGPSFDRGTASLAGGRCRRGHLGIFFLASNRGG